MGCEQQRLSKLKAKLRQQLVAGSAAEGVPVGTGVVFLSIIRVGKKKCFGILKNAYLLKNHCNV